MVHQDTKNLPPFSILLSIYYKENEEYLQACLESIVGQTLRPTEVVMVWDGPLTEGLEQILNRYHEQYPGLFHFVKLEKNQGLGMALNHGLAVCRYEIVLRMDTDDIAYPYRFAKQVAYLAAHPEVSLMCSAIDEFESSPREILRQRSLPEQHEDLVRFARFRCPMNHPSVAFRKEAVLQAGGYKTFFFFEDYYLWVRMIMQGAKLYCFPEPLLAFRMNKNAYRRRRGWRYARNEARLQKEFYRIGFLSLGGYLRNLIVRFPIRLLPTHCLSLFYTTFLRK